MSRSTRRAPAASGQSAAPATKQNASAAGSDGDQATSRQAAEKQDGEALVEVRVLRAHGELVPNQVVSIPAEQVPSAEAEVWACSHPDSIAAARG